MNVLNYAGGRIPRMICGEGTAEALSEHAGGSRRVLIVTDSGYAALGVPERLRALLRGAGIEAQIFSDIAYEPTDRCMDAAIAEMRKGYDTVAGIGGGSALDVAKAAALAGGAYQSLAELSENIQSAQRTAGLIMIPTTCGTGSEVTPNALYLDGENNKAALISREMIADLVLLDGVLLATLPPRVTAYTGMDALAHCMESFTSNNAGPVSDAFAAEGIRLIAENLPAAVEGSTAARGTMLQASMLGGLALSAAGTSAVHALAYPFGKRGVAHGIANGTLLVPVFEELAPFCEGKLRRAAVYFGTDIPGMLAILTGWWQRFGMPQSLRDLRIRDDDVSVMAAESMAFTRLLRNSPAEITPALAEKIYTKLKK